MSRPRSLLDLCDARPLVKGSRLRYGPLETRGVPAILLGVAVIVVAAGASDGLRRAATILPETLREARDFWLAARAPRRELEA